MRSLEGALSRCAAAGIRPGLDAILAVCAAMGDPQDSVRVVHVAGTNGKGAVCALVDSALRAVGFRCGRYTSPHLVSVTERFFLDGAPVSGAELDAAFNRLPRIPQVADLTYFELLTAVAFELYREKRVDFLVLETGLGGRLDATNVVKRPDVCVITSIGLDHCEWLGSDIPSIAAEKGGIIKPGVPVVLGAMPGSARETIERIASVRGAPCVRAMEWMEKGSCGEGADAVGGPIRDCALGGMFNARNAAVALAALKMLGVDDDAIRRGFASAAWPGRYQRIESGGRSFLIDGAHNPPAMRALADSLKREPPVSEGGFSAGAVVCGF